MVIIIKARSDHFFDLGILWQAPVLMMDTLSPDACAFRHSSFGPPTGAASARRRKRRPPNRTIIYHAAHAE